MKNIHSNVNEVNLMVSFDAETIFRHFDEVSSQLVASSMTLNLNDVDTDKSSVPLMLPSKKDCMQISRIKK